ncbi:MAG TPA: LPD7 domain-containing protein [Candidatus Baltobacteraceae bacterium]|jgi:hypothetical protein|nr:LPD7 domain-containing protein [Candidatus Baltobacteraceae bacterium]
MFDDFSSESNAILIFRNKQGLRDETPLPLLEADRGPYPPLKFYRCARSLADGAKRFSYFDMMSNNALAIVDHGGHIDVRIPTRRNVLAALALARQYLRKHQGQLAFKGTERFQKAAEVLARERGIQLHTEIFNELLASSLTWITGPPSSSSAAIVSLDTTKEIDPTTGFAVQKNGVGAIDLLVGRPGNRGIRARGIFRAEEFADRVFYRYVDLTSFRKSANPSFVDLGNRITLIQDNFSAIDLSIDIISISAMLLIAKMKVSWNNKIVLSNAFTPAQPLTFRILREAIRQDIKVINTPLLSEYRRLKEEFLDIQKEMSGRSPEDFHARVADIWVKGEKPQSELGYFKNLLADRFPLYSNLTQHDGRPTPPVSAHQNVTSEDLLSYAAYQQQTERRIPRIQSDLAVLNRGDTELITDWVKSRPTFQSASSKISSSRAIADFEALESFLKLAPPDLTRVTETTLRTILVPWIIDLAGRDDLTRQAKVFRRTILSSFFEYGKQKSLFSTRLVESTKPHLLFLDWFLQTASKSNPISAAQAYADLEELLDIVRTDLSSDVPITLQERFSQWRDNLLSRPDTKPEASTHRSAVIQSFVQFAQTKGEDLRELAHAMEAGTTTSSSLPSYLVGRRDFSFLRSCYKLNAQHDGFIIGFAYFLKFAPNDLQTAAKDDLLQAIDTMTAQLAVGVKSKGIAIRTAQHSVEAVQRFVEYAHKHLLLTPDIIEAMESHLVSGRALFLTTRALPISLAQRPDVRFVGPWYEENHKTLNSVVALRSFLKQAPRDLLTANATELSAGIRAWIDTLTLGIGSGTLNPSTCLKYVGCMKTFLTAAQKYGLPAEVSENGKRALLKGLHDIQRLQTPQDLPAFIERRSDKPFVAAFYLAHPEKGHITPALEMFFRHFSDDPTVATNAKLPALVAEWTNDLTSFIKSDDPRRTHAFKLNLSERYINVVKSFFEYGYRQGVFSQNQLITAKSALDVGKTELRQLSLTRTFPSLITERSDSNMIISWLNTYHGRNDHLCAISDFLQAQPPDLKDITEVRITEELDAWSRKLSSRVETNQIKVKTASHYVFSVSAFFKHHLKTQTSSSHPFHRAIMTLSETQKTINVLRARQPLPTFISERPDKDITGEWYRNHPDQDYATSLKGFLKFASSDLREMNAEQFSQCLSQWREDIDHRLRLQELSPKKASAYILGVRSLLESCEEHLQPRVADVVKCTLSRGQKMGPQPARQIPNEPTREERRSIRVM